MLYLTGQVLHDGHSRLDTDTMTWVPDDTLQEGRQISEREAVCWLQKESGTPLRPPVAVIGPREASDEERAIARELGHRIAALGLTVLCGGRQGVMESVCLGVKEGNGVSVGLLPEDDWRKGNAYVTVPISTGIGIARNALIARAAVAVVAVGGGLGTISEIALSLQFGKRVLGLCHPPYVEGLQLVESLDEAEVELCRAVLGLPARQA